MSVLDAGTVFETAGRRQMPEGGSSIFTDCDGYQAIMQDILDLLALQPREFHARLTWAELPNLQLLRAKEASARVGFLRLPADQVFVTFPTRPDSPLQYGGVTLQAGDLMFHARGEHRHQRTTAACEWATLATTPATLTALGRTLSGRELVAPDVGQVVRPRRVDGRRLERLHARVCHVVERNLGSIANRQVVRALEQELLSTLISCLAEGKLQDDPRKSDRRPEILAAFEAMLAADPYRTLHSLEICTALKISASTLRAECSRALGMSPSRYQRLRRLKLIRAELLSAKSTSATAVEQAVARYGFPSFNSFVTEYWRFYGGMPPIPHLI